MYLFSCIHEGTIAIFKEKPSIEELQSVYYMNLSEDVWQLLLDDGYLSAELLTLKEFEFKGNIAIFEHIYSKL